ncbi:hypothetical protein [Saccharopolyspora sp. ASAGF58]|uniref:hypothetical protein n=1 Tax=Saccharopolyspora sp. ASAGF58 TaxID=2719023 RepID=UPI001B30E3F7|nr:hypothetical protein [Saccharopolyspora sp. ASAGF58]
MGRNSHRDFDQVSPGVCKACDGAGVLWTGGFLGKPNTPVTCPDCDGTGKE